MFIVAKSAIPVNTTPDAKATCVVKPAGNSASVTFKCSTSAAFIDKTPLKGQASYIAFAPQTMTLSGLMAHILKGYAFMPACAAAGGRKGFKFAALLALDFDNDAAESHYSIEALQHNPFIKRYAAGVYATATSTPERPKARVIFLLDESILSAEGFRAATLALMDMSAEAGLLPDPACKDETRLYYGSKGAQHWINPDGPFLPLALLRERAADMRRADEQTAKRLTPGFNAAYKRNQGYAAQARADAQRIENPKKYAETTVNNNAAAAARAPKGTRNDTLFIQAWKTWCVYEALGLTDCGDIDREFWAAGRAAGLPDNEIRVTLASAAKFPRVLLNAMRGRIGPLTPDDPKGGKRGPKNSAHVDNSPLGELTYYADAQEDLHELHAFTDQAQQDAATLAQMPEQAAADVREAVLQGYSPRLPDQWMFALEDAAQGGYAPGLINAINGMLHSGTLKAAFINGEAYTTTKAIIEGLTDAGYTFDEDTIRRALKRIVAAGLIEKIDHKTGDETAHYIYQSLCAVLTPESRHQHVYRLLTDAKLKLCIQARMQESLLDSFYPHSDELSDDLSDRAALLSPDIKRGILDTLKARNDLNALSAESVFAATPQVLKVTPLNKHDDAEIAAARAENTLRKRAFNAAIRAIPMKATANSLSTLSIAAAAAAPLAAALNEARAEFDRCNLIDTKWQLFLIVNQRRLDLLNDTRVTPFSELSLESAKAQIDALRRARLIPFDGMEVSGAKQASLMGVDNRAAAVRMSKRLGLRREVQQDTRALSVMPDDQVITSHDIQEAVKKVIKRGEFATYVRSLDSKGKCIGFAFASDESGLEEMPKGASFEVTVQRTSILHIEEMPERAAKQPAQAAQQAQQTPAAQDAQDAAQQAQQTPARAAGPRRVYRTTLYTPQFVELNVLRGVIHRYKADDMTCFVVVSTGELYTDLRDAVLSLGQMPAHAEAV